MACTDDEYLFMHLQHTWLLLMKNLVGKFPSPSLSELKKTSSGAMPEERPMAPLHIV